MVEVTFIIGDHMSLIGCGEVYRQGSVDYMVIMICRVSCYDGRVEVVADCQVVPDVEA